MIILESDKELKLGWMFLCLVLPVPILVCSIMWYFNRELPYENLLITLTLLLCLWYIKKVTCLIMFCFKKEK